MVKGSRQKIGPMDIFSLLDEVRAIAQNGLFYTSDPFDRERYDRLMELAAQTYSDCSQPHPTKQEFNPLSCSPLLPRSPAHFLPLPP